MTKNASLGPIDVQISSLLRHGSARSWAEVIKRKGSKAEDQSINFAMMGRQYTKTMRAHLNNILDFGMSAKQKSRFADFLTDGRVEHAYALTPVDLAGFGMRVDVIEDKKTLKVLNKLITSNRGEGVTFYKLKRWWWNK